MKKYFFLTLTVFAIIFIACNKDELKEQVASVSENSEVPKDATSNSDDLIFRGPPPCGCTATVTYLSGGPANLLACGLNINQQAVASGCDSSAPSCTYGGGSTTGNYEDTFTLSSTSGAWVFCAGDGAEDFKIENTGNNAIRFRLNIGGTQNPIIQLNVGEAAHVRKSDSCILITPICVY